MAAGETNKAVASQALLAAAIGGLLCAASVGCTTSSSNGSGGAGGAGGAATGTTASGDTPVPATECDGGVAPNPAVTSSSVVANMTQDQFAAQCDAEHGILEVQPHCGGSNACRGMSYDSRTQNLTQHTCRGTNTCAGWSCVVCD